MSNYSKTKQRGVTLLEVTMAIGIIAVIVVSALAYFNSTNLVRETTGLIRNIASLTSGISVVYQKQATYAGIEADAVRASNHIPQEMNGGAAGALAHPWREDGITITDFTFTSPGDSYEITLSDIPLDPCPSLAAGIYEEYIQVEINGSLITQIADITGQCVAGANILTIRHR